MKKCKKILVTRVEIMRNVEFFQFGMRNTEFGMRNSEFGINEIFLPLVEKYFYYI